MSLLWNAYGIVQFAGTAFASRSDLLAKGYSPALADLYVSLPAWLTGAFALGVFGGAAGCLLLLLRRREAVAVLAVSLAGYVTLFLGDLALGVFALFGAGQVVVISATVIIAGGLLALAVFSQPTSGAAPAASQA
ncbi:hypothetical protein GVN21_08005 [Caulobacter sp. SLTY]|uniref:hypothetical protein n=1 Tax=Caulobacter sp. SLTY TaxID=2683262 RepID=UPI001411D611|nr:hypothetical protein [Caulobacter sp. SLTY]NBB15297.1 hypothetical protein [Caulobacter sp. SLTY]